jgi:hypothetical protein
MTLYAHYQLNLNTDRRYAVAQHRHAVRRVYRDTGMTLGEIQLLELRETGRLPHHTTIMHSCRIADKRTVAIVRKTLKALTKPQWRA